MVTAGYKGPGRSGVPAYSVCDHCCGRFNHHHTSNSLPTLKGEQMQRSE